MKAKRVLCKYCMKMQPLEEVHECLNHYGLLVPRMFHVEHIATREDIWEWVKKSKKFKGKK